MLASLAGAAMTWDQSEADTIAEYEQEVFASYIGGLRDAGWTGEEPDVRLAYLSQLVTYVIFFPQITAITLLAEQPRKTFFRSRLGVDDETAVEQCSQRLTTFIHLIDEGMELVG
ncbi:MAG TPA: hypothetical protein EYQ61_11105 [Dehalococcoidia bacterium]|jgi:hypothetical protein|nr:hypothetical protein [Dehalococcoidia bacterium]